MDTETGIDLTEPFGQFGIDLSLIHHLIKRD